MAKKTGSAKKTETFTTRLEPREKYVLELLARLSGRSIAKTLEAAIQKMADETPVKVPGRPEIVPSVQALIGVLWSPQEWKRVICLGGIAPELLTYDEECKLGLLTQSKALCPRVERTYYGGIIDIEVNPRLIEIAWPLIGERASLMAAGEPAPPPTLKEIESASGQKLTEAEEGMHMNFGVFHPKG